MNPTRLDRHNDRVTRPERTAARPALRAGAVLLPAATVVGLAVCVALEAQVDPARLPAGHQTGPGWGSGLIAVVFGLLATTVLWRRPRHRGFALALAGSGVFWALDGISESCVRLGLVTPEPLPGMTFAVWFLQRFTALLPVTVAALLLLFPTGRFLAGRWGAVGRISLGGLVLTCLTYDVAPSAGFTPAAPLPPGVDPDPTTLHVLDPVAAALPPVLLGAQLVFVLPALATAVLRYRRAHGLERERMRWLLWGVLATALCVLLGALVELGPFTLVLLLLTFTLSPAAMTVAVVDPKLLPINELLARTVVYGGSAALILAVDLAAVAALTAVLGDALGRPEVVAVVLLISAALYGPLRGRLWRWVRRALLGERDERYDVVAGLAATLEATDDGAGQLTAVADAVAAAFGVGYVGIEVDRGADRLVATHGVPGGPTRTLPISYRGREVGRVLLPAGGLRSLLRARDERLLGDLVRQAAVVARTSRLAEDLQDSRERLVLAREEERRRIRRDLHDGLGPALSGVVFRLESARLLLARDPAAAGAQLGATTVQVQELVADIRRLVHDLRPPALDDRGLVGALRQLAESLRTPTLTVAVDADDLGPLPAAVEVAAYRIVGEALTNVVRHAAAAHCRVRLAAAGGELRVEVRDDGVGIPADAQAGVGLRSLRERAAELGGHTEVTCPGGGGTVVTARLPVRRSA